MERDYKHWRLTINSYESENGKWRPIVTVSIETKPNAILTKRLLTPPEWAFDTEHESDERGYQLGVTWIDGG